MQSKTFVDGHSVRNAVTSVHHTVVRPKAYRNRTVWVAMYMAGTLNVSNMICVMRSWLALIFIVDGANAVGSFVMCSTIIWKMVPLDNTTFLYSSLRM